MNPKIVLLSGEKIFAKYLYNGLSSFNIHTVIFEESENAGIIYKKRIKKIGRFNVWGQRLFDKFVMKRLIRSSKHRIQKIVKNHNLDNSKIPISKIKNVKSVNDTETISLIRSIDPEIIIVNSTRILSNDLLTSVNSHFINIHSGILPGYRGYSGGYWALVNNDKKNFGSTIHFIDKGIDTGSILCQGLIDIEKEDNYFTYAFLHLAKEIELLKKAIIKICNNDFEIIKNSKKGKLRYGPSIWEYLFYRIAKKVK